MNISWSPLEEALIVTGSRNSAIHSAWCLVPEEERTSGRRKLTIALVDVIREQRALRDATDGEGEAS